MPYVTAEQLAELTATSSANGKKMQAIVDMLAQAGLDVAQLKSEGDVGVEAVGSDEPVTGLGRTTCLASKGVESGGGSFGGAEIVDSWSDEMDEAFDSSEGSVVMPGGVERGSAASGVNFLAEASGGDFFSTYVRTPEVKALRALLKSWGVVVRKNHVEKLALARFSQATIPSAFVNGKERVKVLAKVGDNAMTLVLTDEGYDRGDAVAKVQASCARVLSATALSIVCVRSGLAKFVSFPSGLALEASKPAGEALEAVAGVVYQCCGVKGVEAYMRALQLLH